GVQLELAQREDTTGRDREHDQQHEHAAPEREVDERRQGYWSFSRTPPSTTTRSPPRSPSRTGIMSPARGPVAISRRSNRPGACSTHTTGAPSSCRIAVGGSAGTFRVGPAWRTLPYISGRSRPPGFGMSTWTLIVRLCGSRTSEIRATCPVKV